ncbi:MAG: phosphoenolpyruvate synthase [Cyanobacteria bacterium QS_8_64_29]|nr:MAG: phosphoenolpyruvate synthase [Cyanobacteria bacterium QS_8_64_29]
MPEQSPFILWLAQLGKPDLARVGGKNASLGELLQQLGASGVRVPEGFATTAEAYRHWMAQAGLAQPLRRLLADLDANDVDELRARGRQARALILDSPLLPELRRVIAAAYRQLCERYGEDTDVAVRSSATAEDLPEASFAGQQETFLNVRGERAVLEACHKCFASLFSDRAISYRQQGGFDQLDVALSVGVQKMVRADGASSGVMFSIDTETGFPDAVLITAAYGLGETVVQGAVNPDEYLVFKPTLERGYQPILDKRLGQKALKLVYDAGGSQTTRQVRVPDAERERFCLGDGEILQLARWAVAIERHYGTPMDIEWAQDARTGELFVVQARPETVQSQRDPNALTAYRLQADGEVLASGRSIGSAIGQGRARVMRDPGKIHLFQPGEVLVAEGTDPDWEPIMKQASAIVTDRGGRTCHAAIVARERGIPAIVGTGNGTQAIASEREVTVSCAEGEAGKVYAGRIPYEVERMPLDELPQLRTELMMNVANPDRAFSLAALPCDGIGLARLEFIIANHIQAHPLALLHFDALTDRDAKAEIARLTQHYDDKPQFFVDGLARGIATIAASVYPQPAIVRLSDFKTNEYAHLLGGSQFEPHEANPMLGWRGAARYCDPQYREAFALECRALKQVREEMGLTNVIPMVPFCRTPEEGERVLAEMAANGLQQGENGLQVYVMVELPNNVLMAAEFGRIFDGFSIGSNDLTQLVLGLDRDSALVASLFDERSEGVKHLVRMAIEGAKARGCKIGLCGQAPSDYPEFARFLVEAGIDSISLNPDSLPQARLTVAEAEREAQVIG